MSVVYLGPVPQCGPVGGGWPLGRAVRRAELEAVAVQVEGVEYVEDELRLARLDDATGLWTPSPLVELERWEAPALEVVTVVPGRPARARRPGRRRPAGARSAAAGGLPM